MQYVFVHITICHIKHSSHVEESALLCQQGYMRFQHSYFHSTYHQYQATFTENGVGIHKLDLHLYILTFNIQPGGSGKYRKNVYCICTVIKREIHECLSGFCACWSDKENSISLTGKEREQALACSGLCVCVCMCVCVCV